MIGIPSADGILASYIEGFNPATLTSSSRDSDKVFTKIDSKTGKPVIDYILATYNNFGEQVTEGLDFSVKGKLPRTEIGTFSVGLEGTYLLKQKTRDVGAVEFGDNVVGTYQNSFGPVLRMRHISSVDWERGPYAASATYIWQSSYIDAQLGADGNPRKVAAYDLLNLSVSYTGIKNLKLRVGVLNVLDNDPPYSNQGNSFQVGFDQSYADPRGRTFYATASYKFF